VFNGLNLSGSPTHTRSIAGGFALEKDLKQIEASIKRNASRLQGVVLTEVAPIIATFPRIAAPNEQMISVRALEKYFNDLRRELTDETRVILQTSIAGMLRTSQAAHYSEGRLSE
jgi:hypothetical protein